MRIFEKKARLVDSRGKKNKKYVSRFLFQMKGAMSRER
jgi:hypothetical protein